MSIVAPTYVSVALHACMMICALPFSRLSRVATCGDVLTVGRTLLPAVFSAWFIHQA
jgi:hypothetical protein